VILLFHESHGNLESIITVHASDFLLIGVPIQPFQTATGVLGVLLRNIGRTRLLAAEIHSGVRLTKRWLKRRKELDIIGKIGLRDSSISMHPEDRRNERIEVRKCGDLTLPSPRQDKAARRLRGGSPFACSELGHPCSSKMQSWEPLQMRLSIDSALSASKGQAQISA
jgi:hypothetical protein